MHIIGIDPGKNGAMAVIDTNITANSGVIDVKKFSNATESEICDFFRVYAEQKISFAYIEKVHTMPKQGIVSAFTFGKNFGFLIGCLTCLKIPFEFVSPQKWQKDLGCLSKGDKNVTKTKAQQLFPNIKCTHSDSDALLIAEFGRRVKNK